MQQTHRSQRNEIAKTQISVAYSVALGNDWFPYIKKVLPTELKREEAHLKHK